MSQFQSPITIDQAMRNIANNSYLLPAFQREFCWTSEQIEVLFDSLMREYPTNSMLFWEVKGDTKTKWKFYKFIDKYVKGANNYSIKNELFNTSNSNDFYAVLDGQQRLTAMRIGIYGSYAYHETWKTWEYTKESFPTRHLYLNLSQKGGMDDDCEYFFKFIKDSETKEDAFYIDSNEHIWYKVGCVVDLHKSGEEISDFYEKITLNKEQRKIINRLKTMIFNDLSITFYKEEEQSPDKAVKIFTRINSGGTYLSFSDIVFSLMVANWEKKDAKTEINTLISTVGQKGFEIKKDFIIKAILYLYHRSVKTEINSFTKEFCQTIEQNWDNINDSILSLFDLLKSYGLTSFTLTSNNATLPILYYIYHKNVFYDFTNKVEYKTDREKIKKWLFATILRQTFGGTSDSTLQQSRKAYTEDINDYYIKENDCFDGDKINSNIKNLNAVSEEFIEEILSTQKDNRYAFPILSLLYPNLDYKNNNFHKDHLHAESLYSTLTNDLKEKIPFKIYNSIINLQMLDKNENESKGNMSLEDWISKECKDIEYRQSFLQSHIIPNVDLSLSNIENFIEERKKLLKQKLNDILK